MSTRMTDDTGTRLNDTYSTNRPVVWPWVLLAVIVIVGLWWALAANNRNTTSTTDTGLNNPSMNQAYPGSAGTPGNGATEPAQR